MPVYNRAELVERTLDSIAAQNVRPLELVVVDNGSTDASLATVEAWFERHRDDPGLHIRILEEHRPGAARARQTGLEAVSTEWVQFFDSDDVMLPGLLGEALESGADADLVVWKRVIENLDGRRSMPPYHPSDIFRNHMYNGILSTQSYMVRREFLQGVGGWNPDVRVWDDWELGFRLLMGGPRIKALERAGALVYCQEDSITGTDYSHKAGEWDRIIDLIERDINEFRGNIPAHGLPGKEKMLELLEYRRVNLAAFYAGEGHPEFALPLMESVMRNTELSPTKKILARIMYEYTRRGGRGAYKLWR